MQDAKTQHQIELELLYNKNQLLPRIRNEFINCKDFNFNEYLAEKDIPHGFGIELLTQIALHKRASLPIMVGVLQHLCRSAQECADLLFQCAVADLIDWSPDLQIFVVKFTISDDVQEDLDRFQYPLPMIVEPTWIEDNKQNGYLTSKGSIILRNNHHGDDVCLDHINRMNRIQLTVNLNTVSMVKNKWRNLDKPKEGEKKGDFERRRKAFEKFDRTAKDVIDVLSKETDEFYLTHKYDKRGRTYCQGHHLTYQGNAWCKAIIEFANMEIVQ